MAKSVQSFLYMSLVMTFLTKRWHFPVIMSAVQTAVKLNNMAEAILHVQTGIYDLLLLVKCLLFATSYRVSPLRIKC